MNPRARRILIAAILVLVVPGAFLLLALPMLARLGRELVREAISFHRSDSSAGPSVRSSRASVSAHIGAATSRHPVAVGGLRVVTDRASARDVKGRA